MVKSAVQTRWRKALLPHRLSGIFLRLWEIKIDEEAQQILTTYTWKTKVQVLLQIELNLK